MAIQDEIPKSRITLTYRTNINGEPEMVNLPLRLLVLGDFSQGSSKDQKIELDERQMRSVNNRNLDALIKDMGIKLQLQVANKVTPSESETLEVTLPVNGLKSFSPDEVAKNVPQVKALLLLRTLLLEMQSNIDNRKELRKKIYEIFSKPESLKAAVAQLKGYESYVVPPSASNGALPAGKSAPQLGA